MQKRHLLTCSAACALMTAGLSAPAFAQVDEIIITATKRAETSQNVPIAVTALGEDTLDELRVDVFTDYLVELPGVTAGGAGPGNNTIYIRGLASTTPATSIAGVAGLAPNVAFYLDEQPLVQPGRNLDVYAADLQRVEVLSGPQGTLFGASSQAGTVRMITNKPKIGVEEASFTVGTSFTKGGEASFMGQAVYNVPIGDTMALRGVVYADRQGGWTDAVAGTLNMRESARFRTADATRDNGTVVGEGRAGFKAGLDVNNPNFNAIDAVAIVEEDQNDAEYFGFRVSGLKEFNEDWSVNLAYAQQTLDTEGVFLANPDLGAHEIQAYEESELNDEFSNVSWTVNGRIGALDAVYTGAYTDRTAEQRIDYTEYLYVAQYLPYYICDYSVYAAYDDMIEGTCQAPNLYGVVDSNLEVNTHELRFTTPSENRLRATFGAFTGETVLREVVDFSYPGNNALGPYSGNFGFPDNFRFPGPGYSSDDGAFPQDTIFRNDVRRTDENLGIFGEASYDLTEQFSVTVGARYYENIVDLEGTANSSFCNLFSQQDRNRFGTDINDLYDGDGSYTNTRDCDDDQIITFNVNQTVDQISQELIDAVTASGRENTAGGMADIDNAPSRAIRIFNELRAPDKAEADGVILKVTGTYTPADNLLFYGTYSEGYRPGLLNRPGGAVSGAFAVPFELETDDVRNYEFGWKTRLMDNQLQFNGSAFFVDVTDLQATIFDTSIVNLFFNANVGDAEIKGVEGDLTWAPADISGLTVSGAFSLLDTEITKVAIPTEDVRVGDSLSFAPEYQFNARARYEWETDSGLTAHVMPQIVHSADSFSDIIVKNRDRIEGWTKLSASAGLTGDAWTGELFVDNILDSEIELNRQHINDVSRVNYARPLNAGVRLSVNFK